MFEFEKRSSESKPVQRFENPDGGAVYWTFLLVNADHVDPGDVAVLNTAADAFAGALAGKVLEPGEGGVSRLEFLAGLGIVLAAQEALNLLTANCDGQVASGAFAFTASQLAGMTSTSRLPPRAQNDSEQPRYRQPGRMWLELEL
jgi:hypothetical protein